MNRWMILQRDYGQLGNRLHTHANALAWCIENNVNLLNLSFSILLSILVRIEIIMLKFLL